MSPNPIVSTPVEGTIQLVARMRVARAAATAAAIAGNRVLIVGGMTDGGVALREFEVFDASTNRIVASGEMNASRVGHSATLLVDGRVLVVGGSDPRDRTLFATAEIYDPAAKRWIAAPRMRIGRYKLRDSSLRLRDGRILVAGSGRFAELFDPRTNAFSPVDGSFERAYSFPSSALLDDGRAVVLGGYDDSMRNTDGIWRFRK
jgi:hypothetical protein